MNFVWATRGKTWGFRFLSDGGFDDPLPVYDEALSAARGVTEGVWRSAGGIGVRFPDPNGRRDRSNRIISHDFVVFGDLADQIDSVDDGVRLIWPLVADEFGKIWDLPWAK